MVVPALLRELETPGPSFVLNLEVMLLKLLMLRREADFADWVCKGGPGRCAF